MGCAAKLYLKLNHRLHSSCASCEHLLKCVQEYNITYRDWRQVNCKTNDFNGYSAEVVQYSKIRKILTKCYNLPEVDRKPKMYVLPSGLVQPIKESYTVADLHNNLRQSAHRACDNFYSYALSNEWDYFFTFTFDPSKVNRYNDTVVNNCFTKWLKDTKLTNPDIKVLCVPERHDDGAIHFHGFISNAPNITLTVSCNPHTGKPVYSKCGELLFNMSDWLWGFSTCAVLPKDQNRRKVANYCIQYVTKQANVGYKKKKFHRTRNLELKTSESLLLVQAELAKLVEGMDEYKSNEKVKVYRN